MNLCFPDKTQYPAVGIAVSGGADSVALLIWCCEHKKELPEITVYTFDHRLRGEDGAADAAYVAELAARCGFPCRRFVLPVKAYAKSRKLSAEDAARELRRKVYREAVSRGEICLIATAHHAGDLAETVLFRLLRGTGVTGAAGILPETDGIIHPMLGVTKEEIVAFLKERHLGFCTDATNFDNAYARNFLRNQVLPLIETRFPRAEEALVRFAVLAKEDDDLLQRLSAPCLAEDGTLLFTPEKPLFSRAFLRAAKGAGLKEGYTSRMVQDAFALFSKDVGAKIELIRGFYAERTRAGVRVFPSRAEAVAVPFFVGEQNFPCGKMRIEKLSVAEAFGKKEKPPFPVKQAAELSEVREFFISGDVVEQNAILRSVRRGDRFQPFGHKTEKKLKDFLSSRGVNSYDKARILVLESGGKIVAALPEEIADFARMTQKTTDVYRILIQTEKE